MLKNFFDGKILKTAPQRRNFLFEWFSYVSSHPDDDLLDGRGKAEALCWGGFAPACEYAANQGYAQKIFDLGESMPREMNGEDEKWYAQERKKLGVERTHLLLLSCLQGGVPQCTSFDDDSIPFAPALLRQMEEFCVQGHPGYCTAAGVVLSRYMRGPDHPLPEEDFQKIDDFYRRGCFEGDMSGCVHGLMAKSDENLEKFIEPLRRDCERGEGESVQDDWSRSSSCKELVQGMKFNGRVEEVYDLAVAACDREQTSLCYDMIEVAAERKDRESVYQLMKKFCIQQSQPGHGQFGGSPDDKACARIAASDELTDAIWRLIKVQPSTLWFSGDSPRRTVRDVFEGIF